VGGSSCRSFALPTTAVPRHPDALQEAAAALEARSSSRGQEYITPLEARSSTRGQEYITPLEARSSTRGQEYLTPLEARSSTRGQEYLTPLEARSSTRGQEYLTPRAAAEAPASTSYQRAPVRPSSRLRRERFLSRRPDFAGTWVQVSPGRGCRRGGRRNQTCQPRNDEEAEGGSCRYRCRRSGLFTGRASLSGCVSGEVAI
jgi:hypothetical protein